MDCRAIKDGEEYLTCPYNPAHRIIKSRMQTHLVKCKENYPDVKIVTCKFNTTHRIPEPEINYHHQNCPDKLLLDKHIYVPNDVDRDKYPVMVEDVPTEESWDNIDVSTYDPEKYCKEKPILRRIDLAPKSKRNEFKESERLRFSYINEEMKRLGKDEPILRKPIPGGDSIIDDLARDLQITRMTGPTNTTYLTQSKNADNVKTEKSNDVGPSVSTGAIRKQPPINNSNRGDENENPSTRDSGLKEDNFPTLGNATAPSPLKLQGSWTRIGKGRSRPK